MYGPNTLKTKKITCNHCGAALAIKGTPNYVDCRFCGTSLRIVRTASAIFTEVREEVKAIGAEVSGLRKESKLRALDERWHKEQMKLAIGNWPGPMSKYHPTKDAAQLFGVLGGLCCVAFCILALYFRDSDKGLSLFTALITGILTLVGVVWANYRHNRYVIAENAYLARRQLIELGTSKPRKNKKKPARMTADESTEADRSAKRSASKKRRDAKRLSTP